MAPRTMQTFTREQVSKHNKADALWVIIDSNIYDLSRFKDLHPGGISVLLEDAIPGQDATDAFYGLHKHEVLKRPRYARLHIGTIEGEKSAITSGEIGELSRVPYAESTWLSSGFYSPYYKESHRKLQVALRKLVDEVIKPEALVHEESGKRIGQGVVDALAEHNIIAM